MDRTQDPAQSPSTPEPVDYLLILTAQQHRSGVTGTWTKLVRIHGADVTREELYHHAIQQWRLSSPASTDEPITVSYFSAEPNRIAR